LQTAADTTNIEAFGVRLKLIAAQDVGGRDQDLFDSIIIDDKENSTLVVEMFKKALKDFPGAQAITDQGTPYMAAETKKALDELGVEHVPQREATPTAKSTIERAFRTAKDIAGPIFNITTRIASTIPSLRNTDLAKAAALVILTALLRAYQAGARATRRAIEQRGDVDVDRLAQIADDARERARATDSSARLLLGHLHELYALPGPANAFINNLRHYPVEVLREAERAFRRQVSRNDIKDRASYFAAIVRSIFEEHSDRKAAERRRAEDDRRRAAEIESVRATHRRWDANPTSAIAAALDALANQWSPTRQALIAGGAGAPRAWLRSALTALIDQYSFTAARDVLAGVFDTFVRCKSDLEAPAIQAIRLLLDRLLDELGAARGDACCNAASAIGKLIPPGGKSRSPPVEVMRN
jgi:hypothetical protein